MTDKHTRTTDQGGCPGCGEDLQINYDNLEMQDGAVWQPATCLKCGARWNEVYSLTAVEVCNADGEPTDDYRPLGLQALADHIGAMRGDPYLEGHPEFVAILSEAAGQAVSAKGDIGKGPLPVAKIGAGARRAVRRIETGHVKVKHGRCSVCGHYGDDCNGDNPEEIIEQETQASALAALLMEWAGPGVEYLDEYGERVPAEDYWPDGCQRSRKLLIQVGALR